MLFDTVTIANSTHISQASAISTLQVVSRRSESAHTHSHANANAYMMILNVRASEIAYDYAQHSQTAAQAAQAARN